MAHKNLRKAKISKTEPHKTYKERLEVGNRQGPGNNAVLMF